MVASRVSNEMLSPVAPSRLWKAVVKDSHNLMPKLMPDIISSIVVLEGNGGVGTIGQSNFTSGIYASSAKYAAIKDFSYWKDRVEAIDDEKRVFRYSVIEGGLIGKKVKSTLFELKFEDGADGGSVCKFKGEYETIEDSLPTEAETTEMMGSMVGMFKAIEGYLIANSDVYV
ncbi:major pollen allergen Bet v 1-F/I [Cinnamomum micranthum f. kanehirae]|uniref:Major pollen allergen Bet v 1-F/I n=1 Tax=Cinnamomum micranthum f. kanehirae TaxID=337451 RepID=A0A3S3PDE0_9MAGN|nr:major pollen allergen Bet v 1-F/I [Cinnamomum micranthum f. kanehirae]